jgi:hypothetical protein
MARMKKLTMFAAVLGASLAAISTAGAARVRVTGGTRITASGQTGSRIINHPGSQTWTCSAERAEGALRPHTTGVFPVGVAHRMSLSFTSCGITPGISITMSCAPVQVRVTGATVSGVTPVSIANLQCDIRLGTGTTNSCHVTTLNGITGGSTAGLSYSNAGTLTLDQFHTNVGFTGSPSGCILKNSTSVRLQNSTGGNLVYNVSPAVSISAS